MSRTTVGIIAAAILVIAAIAYLATKPGPGPGPGRQIVITVSISYDATTNSCLINPMPASVDSGDTVDWQQQQGLPFTVTFPATTAFNSGSPFQNPLATGWQTKFASPDGRPVSSGQAERTAWEKLFGIHDFPLQTITVTVNGQDQVCYDKSKNEIQGMKVIVTQ
jgi:hypothetical protein